MKHTDFYEIDVLSGEATHIDVGSIFGGQNDEQIKSIMLEICYF